MTGHLRQMEWKKDSGMRLFRSLMTEELERCVQAFPEPRWLVVPEHMRFYFYDALDERVRRCLFQMYVPLSQLVNEQKLAKVATVVYVTLSDRECARAVVASFSKVRNAQKLVLEIPRFTTILETTLAMEGFVVVQGSVPADPVRQISVVGFSADFTPVERDYFLMPCQNTFKKYVVDANTDDLYTSALALVKLQSVVGRIPCVVTVGSAAERVRDVMRQLDQKTSDVCSVPEISLLILFDRRCDMVAPLLTQGNVEGTIKSAFGVNYGYVGPDDLPMEESTPKLVVRRSAQKLSEDIQIYSAIRMKSLQGAELYRTRVDAHMKKQAEDFKKYVEGQSHEGKDNAKVFASSSWLFACYGIMFKADQELVKRYRLYTGILDREFGLLFSKRDVVDLAENLITVYNDWRSAMRLLALQSACGVGKLSWDKIQVELCAEFGMECQESLIDFEKTGLHAPDKAPLPLSDWSNKEKFVDFDSTKHKPLSPEGTAMGGYVHRSVQIIQRIVEDNIKLIPQKTRNQLHIETLGKRPAPDPEEPTKVAVFFIGGVTATEVGTLRNLGRKMFKGKTEFIVGSTDEITSDLFMSQFFPHIYR